jgi:hypothetical protein
VEYSIKFEDIVQFLLEPCNTKIMMDIGMPQLYKKHEIVKILFAPDELASGQ